MDRRDFFKVGGAIIATAPFISIPTGESTEKVRVAPLVPFLLVDTPNCIKYASRKGFKKPWHLGQQPQRLAPKSVEGLENVVPEEDA